MEDSKLLEGLLSNKTRIVRELTDECSPDISIEKFITLARVFEEIKIKNIPLNEEIEYLVAQKLVDGRFFVAKSKTINETVLTLENVLMRIKIIKENSELLVNKYYHNDMDDEFAIRVRLIIQHMNILKKYLKTTFEKLPWEEMEFCLLAMLISFSEQNEQSTVYALVLDKKRILRYLKTFTTVLKTVSESFQKNDINSKLRLQSRNCLMKAVISNNMSFKSLYSDFEVVRDIYSLQKISHYIQQTLEAEQLVSKEFEKLIIQRTLQVIGEYLKNVGESPNVSNHVHDILIDSAPPELKDILTSLRDSLSHAHSLIERFNIENNQNEFFSKLRNDLKIIQMEIHIVMNERKIQAFLAFSNKIKECSCFEDAEYLLSNVPLLNAVFKNHQDKVYNFTEVKKIEGIIAEIHQEIIDKTDYEMMLFAKIDELLLLQKQKINESEVMLKNSFLLFKKLIHDVRKSSDLCHIKKMFCNSDRVVKGIRKKATNYFERIGYYINEIYKSLLSRKPASKMKEVHDLISKLILVNRIETNCVKIIQNFKIDLDKDDDPSENNNGSEVEEIIESLLSSSSSEVWRKKILERCESKRLISDVKSELNAILIKMKQNKSYVIDNEKISEWYKLVKQLDTKKQTEDRLISHYKNKNIKGCENLLNLIRDTYTALKKSFKVHNIFLNDKQISAVKGLLDSLKFEKNEVESIMKEIMENVKTKAKNYYSKRLTILKTVLNIENQQNISDTIKKYNIDRTMQIIIEASMLDLLEILEDMSLLTDNRLFIDDFSPLMIGKALRNYIAHGNAFLDILPYKPPLSLLCNAFKLIELGEDLLNMTNVIIGNTKIYNDEYLQTHHEETLSYIKIQSNMFHYASKNNIENIEISINDGANIFGKTIRGYTILHYSAKTNSVEAFEFLLEEYSKVNFLNHDKMKVLHECFHLATLHGCDKIIDYYLEKGLDISHYSDGTIIINLLTKYGYIEIIKRLITKNIYNMITLCNDNKHSPLHVASAYNQIDILKLLLQTCNVKATSSCLYTALQFASMNGHERITKILLEHIDEKYINKTSNGLTPLYLAANSGHENVVSLLIKHNADPCTKIKFLNDISLTPVELSALNNHFNVFKILFDCTFNRNSLLHQNDSNEILIGILKFVSFNGNVDILKFLSEKSVNINQILVEGSNCLHLSCENDHIEMTEFLISNGIDVNLINSTGLTSLHLASLNGNIRIVKSLLSAGAKVDMIDQNGLTPLCLACHHGHTDIALILVEHGADVNLIGIKKITPLHAAVSSINLELVNILIKKGASVNAKTNKGLTPLHLASHLGLDDIICSLLKNGAEIDITNDNHYTALHLASKSSVVKILLDNNANVDASSIKVNGDYKEEEMWCDCGIILNINGLTPMHLAAQNGHLDIVSLLINKRAALDTPNENGHTPLVLAVQCGHTKIVNLLILKGANLNVKMEDNKTPLMYAIQENHKKTAILLLKSGASINEFSIHKYTALHVACHYGYVSLVCVLIQYGADLEMKTTEGNTCLGLAVLSGSVEVVQQLINSGANLDAENDDLFTPLFLAVSLKNREVVTVLCKAGAKVNPKRLTGGIKTIIITHETSKKISSIQSEREYTHSPLIEAVLRNHYDIVCDLLSYGADPNFEISDSRDALHFACVHGYLNIVKKLVSSGANIEAKTPQLLLTPLFLAVQGDHFDVVKFLLKANANVNIADIRGRRPLLMAIEKCDVRTLTILLKYGADVNQTSNDITPLYLACELLYYDKVRVLLENKANVNISTKGWSPLHMAASKNDSEEIVCLLLSYNADIEFATIEGIKPLHLAAQNGCAKVVEILLSRGAKADVSALNGLTPIHLASYYAHFDIVDSLIKHGANVNFIIEQEGYIAL